MLLSEIIAEKISQSGPISFRDFMDMALYYPEMGYYTSQTTKIGRDGDYYTSPVLSSVFGELIAKQIEEMWRLSGGGEFNILEYGAGAGTLCINIIKSLYESELYNNLHYYIIDKSPCMQEKENHLLPEKVIRLDSIKDIPPFTGCVLSNELLDNFAVHQVVMQNELMEVFVDFHDGAFFEVLQPARDNLKDYFNQLNIKLPSGFRTEINLEAINWIKDISEVLNKGFVITIDYGFPSYELYSPKRRSGTLLCYSHHKINDQPFNNIGGQDITTHVNFSALYHWGMKNGLNCCGYTDQGHFLHGLGISEHLRKTENSFQNGQSPYQPGQVYTLLMDMGNKLKVMIQQKGIRQSRLSGLMFSQPVRHFIL